MNSKSASGPTRLERNRLANHPHHTPYNHLRNPNTQLPNNHAAPKPPRDHSALAPSPSPLRMVTTVAIFVVLVSILGIVLTLLTLPGIWFSILFAALAQWWHIEYHAGPMFSWWTLGVVVGIAVLAELLEFFASAVGTASAGGSRRGAIGSVLGGLIGALAGTFLILIPIVGTLVGATLGAGLGALLAERHAGRATWRKSGRIGAGAAVGRLAASLIKGGLAVVVALILSIAAFV